MSNASQLYTLGTWTVKPGNERVFIAEWETFARWTAKNLAGAGMAYLLQDAERPEQFISFGPWESAEHVRLWRERPEFRAFAVKVRELCSDFQPHTLSVVASSE